MSPTPIGPRHQTHPQLATAISIMQLCVLVVGVAGVFITLGRKDAILERQDRDLTELRSIVGDLVKSQVLGAANDQKHGEALQQVAVRLDRLEGRR
jgi:hypothetical protein